MRIPLLIIPLIVMLWTCKSPEDPHFAFAGTPSVVYNMAMNPEQSDYDVWILTPMIVCLLI